MSEIENTTNKDNIRGQLNLVFALMKTLSTILDLASNNPMAREVATTMADSITKQSSALNSDVKQYIDGLSETSND